MAFDIIFNIESVDKQKINNEHYTFEIRGWALTGKGKTPLIKIHSTHQKEIEYIIQYYIREDVCNKYKISDLLYCGFNISWTSKKNCKRIDIVFIDDTAKEYKKASIQLNNKAFLNKYKHMVLIAISLLKDKGVFWLITKIYNKIAIKLHKNIINNLYGLKVEKEDLSLAIAKINQLNKVYVPRSTGQPLKDKSVKLICFYLPQYHAIPENNTWWGDGFTEWTYVKAAQPQFEEHYQPHMPGDLGYYSLLDLDVQKQQVEIAKLYGIEGFCFYFYWFAGKRLLEKPIENFLSCRDLDFPFCLCWANENWTRRWDGLDNEVLIAQNHSVEDDIAFISYIAKYLRDSRYIRINGKPLLIVYRPGLLPDVRKTAARWRKWCSDNGIGDIHIAYTQSFETVSPEKYGFDAAIEFPPNESSPPNVSKLVVPFHKNFACKVYDWRVFVERSRNYKCPSYTLYRGVCPSWDNTPRRNNNSTIFILNSPVGYKEWLQNAISDTVKRFGNKDERLIFINAWNEWAEGAYLEPSKREGYAYLQATFEALADKTLKQNRKSIIYVCHDAHFFGAQLLSLNIVKLLSNHFNYSVHMLLLSGGVLQSDYEKYARVYNIEDHYNSNNKISDLIKNLKNNGLEIAICNTVITGKILEQLSKHCLKTLSLIHELPGVIKKYNAENSAIAISKYADNIVFASDYINKHFQSVVNTANFNHRIVPQGLYKHNKYKNSCGEARTELRKELNITESAKIILGVGYADYRKGIDLFVDIAKDLVGDNQDYYFVWLGNKDKESFCKILKKLKGYKHAKNIIFVDAQYETDLFYAGADLYLMTSREDPFPSVILEAMDVGIPVIGFEGAGGFTDIVTEKTGILVPYLDTIEMSKAVKKLLEDKKLRDSLGKQSRHLINTEFGFIDYIYKLLTLLGHEYYKVSVIIPNYNYAHYIEKRIGSILEQTYPIYEIIILDDFSTDNSVEVVKQVVKNNKFENFTLIENKRNSGSVFKQWQKGIECAKGDYIWIAEADDLCETTFLEDVMQGFNDNDVVLSYSQSKQMDETGYIIDENYLEYTSDIDIDKWKNNYRRSGIEEISDTLAIKNTIPNISAVVSKKSDAHEILNFKCDYKVACDWYFFIRLLEKGKINYIAKSLNMHRRHNRSITKKLDSEVHFNEIKQMQDYVCEQFDVSENIREKALKYREKVNDILFTHRNY